MEKVTPNQPLHISDVLVVQGSISIDEKTDIIPPLILGAIFVFFFIILLISLFCFCRRKKRKPPGRLGTLVDHLLFHHLCYLLMF